MSVLIEPKTGRRFIDIDLTGKISKEDYERLAPQIEELIRQQGKVRLLVRMHDFHGWTAGGFWEEIKFDLKHFKDIERIAFVGDQKWEEKMTGLCKTFTTGAVRFFYPGQLDQATAWLEE